MIDEPPDGFCAMSAKLPFHRLHNTIVVMTNRKSKLVYVRDSLRGPGSPSARLSLIPAYHTRTDYKGKGSLRLIPVWQGLIRMQSSEIDTTVQNSPAGSISGHSLSLRRQTRHLAMTNCPMNRLLIACIPSFHARNWIRRWVTTF